jgi:2',3'-cyclic-nucleotide 2'-phosphodiesterase (5'-nucleotidase family)
MSSSTARSRRSALALVLLAIVLTACELTPYAPSATLHIEPLASDGPLGPNGILILHTNDIHGRMEPEHISSSNGGFDNGGVANLAALVTRERTIAPGRTLLLDAGDAWQGSFVSNANRGAAMVEAMNVMGYDAQALGNHDFDWGQDVLRARASEAHFPFLAANVVDDATGGVLPFAKPYIVKDLGIAKIGIIGIANPSTPAINKPANVKGLRFLPAADAVRKYLPEVRAQADVIVLLTHISQHGVDEDVQLARDVPGIDLIVSGHSHTALQNPVRESATTIVQAGSYSQYLGQVRMEFDPATRHARVTGAGLLPVVGGKLPPDPAVAKIVETRAAEAKTVTSRVVGRTSLDLPQETRGESALGNLIADAMLEYCRGQGWHSDVALYNGSGIRSSIPAGDITYGKVYEVLPFDDVVVDIDLMGGQLVTIFGRSISDRGANLAIAGGTFTYRAAGTITSATIGGASLASERVYHVCTIDYLALGGDGQSTFTSGKNLVYGDIAADVVADYLSAHSPVAPKVEGRIAQR